MKSVYKTEGTCSSLIELEVESGIIKDVCFTSGCNGNLQGISLLVSGMSASEVVKRLEGVKCGRKNTSCPDQLAKALRQAVEETD